MWSGDGDGTKGGKKLYIDVEEKGTVEYKEEKGKIKGGEREGQ